MVLVDRGGSNRGGAEEARGTHNPEDIGSNPISGISSYRVHRSIWTTPRQINRHGAEEARGAHNSEDVRSKLTAGISSYRVHRSIWTIPRHRRQKSTDMAQGQRARLITLRT